MMSDHIDLSEIEPQDRDTARALIAAFAGVELHQPFTVATAEEDATAAAALEEAFDGIRLDRPAPGGTTTGGTATEGVFKPGRTTGRRRGHVLWLSGAAMAVVALVLTVTLTPGGSSVAWSAQPTAPTEVDREAAGEACGAPLARGLGELESSGSAAVDGAAAPAPEPGESAPVSLPPLAVLDIRGDGALAVYQDRTWQVACLLTREGGAWVDQGITVGPASSTPGAMFGSSTAWVGGDSVTYLGGSVPSGTTKVTFDLSDGTTVRASLLGDTFAAWFPGDRSYVPGSLLTYGADGRPRP